MYCLFNAYELTTPYSIFLSDKMTQSDAYCKVKFKKKVKKKGIYCLTTLLDYTTSMFCALRLCINRSLITSAELLPDIIVPQNLYLLDKNDQCHPIQMKKNNIDYPNTHPSTCQIEVYVTCWSVSHRLELKNDK